jgi:hypothetical protein
MTDARRVMTRSCLPKKAADLPKLDAALSAWTRQALRKLNPLLAEFRDNRKVANDDFDSHRKS